MSDSIKELIVKNIVTALTAITTVNGYDNTIASVQRPLQSGNTFSSVPMLMVIQGDDDRTELSEPYITKNLPIAIVIMTTIDTGTDTRSIDEVLNSIACDVERAMTANPAVCQRGGYALDTNFLSMGQYEPQEGQPEAGTVMIFEITYRHRQGDPKSL